MIMKKRKALTQSFLQIIGGSKMGTIVCQVCESTIEHFEDEKVTVLYGHCCQECASDTHEHVEV